MPGPVWKLWRRNIKSLALARDKNLNTLANHAACSPQSVLSHLKRMDLNKGRRGTVQYKVRIVPEAMLNMVYFKLYKNLYRIQSPVLLKVPFSHTFTLT